MKHLSESPEHLELTKERIRRAMDGFTAELLAAVDRGAKVRIEAAGIQYPGGPPRSVEIRIVENGH